MDPKIIDGKALALKHQDKLKVIINLKLPPIW